MNKTCAVDTETTGVDLTGSSIVEISIVPLNDEYEQDETMKPLSVLVNPGIFALECGSEALSFNGIGRDKILKDGIPQEDMYGIIKGWMIANGITQIVPLGHNYGFDRVMIARMLGNDRASELFFRRVKDSHSLAIAINDAYMAVSDKPLFKSTTLGSLAKFFGMEPEGAHRAEFDCIMTAFVYKNLLKYIPFEGEK